MYQPCVDRLGVCPYNKIVLHSEGLCLVRSATSQRHPSKSISIHCKSKSANASFATRATLNRGKFRTLRSRHARAIAGHSMGGSYGPI
jgi:hypothetical protein